MNQKIVKKTFRINQDRFSISCLLYGTDLHRIRDVVVFCHGFAGHKEANAAAHFADRALPKNKTLAVCTFNWPCHGDDVKKKLRIPECLQYLHLVTEYLQDHFKAQNLYACGVSFGGYLLLVDLHENGKSFQKMVLRSPAIPIYRSMTEKIMSASDREKIEKGKEALVGFDRLIPVDAEFLRELREIDVMQFDYLDYADDLLIIHGTDDELIDYHTIQKFAEENVIELIGVEGADHRFRNPLSAEQVIRGILEFFEFNR